MSLLLDARKKVELTLQQDSPDKVLSELSVDDASALSARSRTGNSAHAAHPDATQRATGKNLFSAKSAPAHARGRLGIIPIAIISGLVLAAGGGFYIWRELSPQPQALRQNPLPVAAPIIAPIATTASLAPAPISAPSPEAQPATTKKSPAKQKRGVKAKPAASSRAMPQPIDAKPPLAIEHKQENDAVDPVLLSAWQAYRSGDLDTARQHYSEVLRKNAQNRDALLGMAAIAQQQSQDAIAARYYGQVLVHDPRDPIANAGIAALRGVADATGTESHLKLMLAQQPRSSGTQSAALYFALGNLYAEQSRWSEAQQAYFGASNLVPDSAQFAFNLAVSLDHMGQGKPAAQHYQRALQLDTSNNAGFDRAQTQRRINELTAH